eukprot:3099605-Prymnesium_polylepis.1
MLLNRVNLGAYGRDMTYEQNKRNAVPHSTHGAPGPTQRHACNKRHRRQNVWSRNYNDQTVIYHRLKQDKRNKKVKISSFWYKITSKDKFILVQSVPVLKWDADPPHVWIAVP